MLIFLRTQYERQPVTNIIEELASALSPRFFDARKTYLSAHLTSLLEELRVLHATHSADQVAIELSSEGGDFTHRDALLHDLRVLYKKNSVDCKAGNNPADALCESNLERCDMLVEELRSI